MERELKKNLMEIEHLIKDHEQRGNTHTQSVLQIAYEVIEPCAKAARTLHDLKEILERDTAKEPKVFDGHWYECPTCGMYAGGLKGDFCHRCGQRLKWEVE